MVVTGMGENAGSAILVLVNEINSENLSITTDGSYTFAFSIVEGQNYNIQISADSIFEDGFACSTGGGITGTMSTSDLSYTVTCEEGQEGNKFDYFFFNVLSIQYKLFIS